MNRYGTRLWSHLSFREIQVHGDFVAPQSSQVVVMGELGLQFSNLLFGERRPLLSWLVAHVRFVIPILGLLKEKERKKTFPYTRYSHEALRRHSNTSNSATCLKPANVHFNAILLIKNTEGMPEMLQYNESRGEYEIVPNIFYNTAISCAIFGRTMSWLSPQHFPKSSFDCYWIFLQYPCSFNMEQNSTGRCVKIYFLSLFTSKLYKHISLVAQRLPAHDGFRLSVILFLSITLNYCTFPIVLDAFVCDTLHITQDT